MVARGSTMAIQVEEAKRAIFWSWPRGFSSSLGSPLNTRKSHKLNEKKAGKMRGF